LEVKKTLLLAVLVALSATGILAYVALASQSPSPANGQRTAGGASGDLLVENIQLPDAVLMGVHKGQKPIVAYMLVTYGPRHTTALAYAYAFMGIAEVSNCSLVAKANAMNATWSNSDFKVIRHDGRPVGLAMVFRLSGPLYIEYEDPSLGQSGYYEVNMTLVLMAIYHPGLEETIFATCGQNSSLVVYHVKGGLVLAAGFRLSGWPSEPSDTRLVMAFTIRLRAASWLGEGTDREKADVRWVVPFCGSTRPRLVTHRALIRGTFAFLPRAAIRNSTGGWEPARAACIYVVKGFTLRLAIIVPKADVVVWPAVRH